MAESGPTHPLALHLLATVTRHRKLWRYQRCRCGWRGESFDQHLFDVVQGAVFAWERQQADERTLKP